MSDETRVVMIIKFVNGTEQKFEFPRQSNDTFTAGAQIQDALSKNSILVELEDKVLVFPFQSILSLEISPSPLKLPKGTIKNAIII